MEHFPPRDSLSDLKFKGMVYDAAFQEKKPFQNFKMLVESSDYRQDWFDFRDFANIGWVKEQNLKVMNNSISQKNNFLAKTSFYIFADSISLN